MKQDSMYVDSVKQWNPFVGCKYDCLYCKSSFQRQAKRQKQNCMSCYRYEPHEHPNRLDDSLPPTGPGEFIFTCANSDITFCTTEYLKKIIERIKREPKKTFVIQSKNPKTFARVTFPANVILGTTIETNRDELNKQAKISKAPPPSQRFTDFLKIKHARKMVTIEPVLKFDLAVMLDWIKQLKPIKVWIGYDSKSNTLPEPEVSEVKALEKAIKALDLGIEVKEKKMRDIIMEQNAQAETPKKAKIIMKNKTQPKAKSPRLTAEQKQQLMELGKTKNAAECQREMNISYAQAYAFISKLKGKQEKPTVKAKADTTTTPTETLGTAKEIDALIRQKQLEIVELTKLRKAKAKAEIAELTKLV